MLQAIIKLKCRAYQNINVLTLKILWSALTESAIAVLYIGDLQGFVKNSEFV